MLHRSSTGACCRRRRTDGDDRRRAGGRRREIPQLERPVERHQPAPGRPGDKVRSDQGLGTGAAGPADAGISEGPGGQHGRPGQGRARQLPDRPVSPGRHAAHDGIAGAGIHHHAGNHLYLGSAVETSSDLHRRTRLADEHRADLSGLFDRQMDRRGRRRPSTTCSRSRPAARSRGPAPTTQPGCPCTSTISRPSRSGSISTRTIRTSFMTRSPCSTTP